MSHPSHRSATCRHVRSHVGAAGVGAVAGVGVGAGALLVPLMLPQLLPVLADAACDAEAYDDDVAWQQAGLIVVAAVVVDDAVHTLAAPFAHPAAVLPSV